MGRTSALAPGMVLLLAAATFPARAQEASVEALDVTVEKPALEFRTNGPWARLALRGRQSIAGRSPLRVPGPLLGDFWLEASGPGVELQRGRVRFSLDDTGSRVFSYGGTPLRTSLARGVVFPGLSQLRSRQPVKGGTLAGLAAAGIGLALWANDDLGSARDAAQTLGDRIAATIDPDTLAVVTEAFYDARAEESHFRRRRDLMVKATGVVWAVGLIDAVAFSPRFQVRDADETSVTLSLRTRTRARALARSLVFPGLGQEYNGDRGKALWVGGGGILAASYLVFRQDELEREEAGLTQAGVRLMDSPGPAALAQRDGRLRDVEDARSARDVALWVAGGVWGLAMLDTALSFQEPWGDIPVEGTSTGTVGWTVDPLRGALAARLRF
jgi:TM2 domain-containing membrane protein YozV